jgi:hypothetical protein
METFLERQEDIQETKAEQVARIEKSLGYSNDVWTILDIINAEESGNLEQAERIVKEFRENTLRRVQKSLGEKPSLQKTFSVENLKTSEEAVA